jgi:hypothetical protein
MPKPVTGSLRGGLLRLMMAGLFDALCQNPVFLVQLFVSEVVSYLSKLRKEDLLMVIKVLRETKSFANKLVSDAIIAWEFHLPYRSSLLKSW